MTSLLRRHRSEPDKPGRWTRPDWSQPLPVDPKVLKPLGKIGETQWYSSPWGDLEEGAVYTEREAARVPEGPVLITGTGADRLYQTFRVYPPGEYAQRLAKASELKPAPKPLAPADALAGSAFDKLPGTLFVGNAATDNPFLIGLSNGSAGAPPAEGYRVRGAPAMLDRLERKQIRLFLSADSTSIVIRAPHGRLLNSWRDAIRDAEPLLFPFIRDGVEPPCAVSAHEPPVPAIGVAVGAPANVPWCMECGR